MLKKFKKNLNNLVINSSVKYHTFNEFCNYKNFAKEVIIDCVMISLMVLISNEIIKEAEPKFSVLMILGIIYFMYSLYSKEIILNYSQKEFSQEFTIKDLLKGLFSISYLFFFKFLRYLRIHSSINDYYFYLNNRYNDQCYLDEIREANYEHLKNFNYELLLTSGINNYLTSFFGRCEPTLIKFFQERIKDYKKNLQENLIFYSLLIPKRETLSVDALKTILMNNQFPNNKPLVFDNLDFNEIIYHNYKIDNAFINYSDEDIKRLFTKYYDYKTLIEVIKLIYKHEVKIPVMKSLEEIYFFLLEVNEEVSGGTFKLNQLENLPVLKDLEKDFIVKHSGINIPIYKFYVFRDMSDLYSWGSSLKNCLESDSRHYKNKILSKTFYLIGIYKNNKKFAAMVITEKGSILEIRTKLNNSIPSFDEIIVKSILKNTFKNHNYQE